MLGRAVKKVFSDVNIVEFTLDVLDITILDDVVKKVKDAGPEFLIHAAAFTEVDQCELEKERAFLVNGIGTRNVAMACEEIRCPVIYISTDYVFGGSKDTPYDEWDRPDPINSYGLSKFMGEQFVSALTNRFYIVRTSWLYGQYGRHFVDTVMRLLREKESLSIVNDQIGSPTYTEDLAQKIKELMGRGYGIYHVTNAGYCTWYDFAMTIAKKKGINKEILPVSSDEYKRPARRPAYSVLGNTMLKLEGLREPRHWEEALEEYLH